MMPLNLPTLLSSFCICCQSISDYLNGFQRWGFFSWRHRSKSSAHARVIFSTSCFGKTKTKKYRSLKDWSWWNEESTSSKLTLKNPAQKTTILSRNPKTTLIAQRLTKKFLHFSQTQRQEVSQLWRNVQFLQFQISESDYCRAAWLSRWQIFSVFKLKRIEM